MSLTPYGLRLHPPPSFPPFCRITTGTGDSLFNLSSKCQACWYDIFRFFAAAWIEPSANTCLSKRIWLLPKNNSPSLLKVRLASIENNCRLILFVLLLVSTTEKRHPEVHFRGIVFGLDNTKTVPNRVTIWHSVI